MVTVQAASGCVFANEFHSIGKDEILTQGCSSQHADVWQGTRVCMGILMWNSLMSWLSQEESHGETLPMLALELLKMNLNDRNK